ncbi:MAG: carbonic anhydrase family protein [Flavobacteriaceae bacterium]
MIRFVLSVFLIALLMLCACKEVGKTNEAASQTPYMEPLVLQGMEHGLILPPINILPVSGDTVSYRIQLRPGEDGKLLERMGKKEEISFESTPSLMVKGRQYAFRHLHFHTPGHHLIEGIQFPMEFHVVTQPIDKGIGSEEYLVIATLFKIGEENQFIDEILKLSSEMGKSKEETELNILLGGQSMVIKTNLDMEGYYHYTGPLATKPFGDTVQWYVAHRIFEISPEQFERIKNLQAQ